MFSVSQSRHQRGCSLVHGFDAEHAKATRGSYDPCSAAEVSLRVLTSHKHPDKRTAKANVADTGQPAPVCTVSGVLELRRRGREACHVQHGEVRGCGQEVAGKGAARS